MEKTFSRRELGRLAAGGLAATVGLERVAAAAHAPRPRGDGDSGKPFRLRYILASCMYGTMRLVEILPEVAKSGSREIDIWPRVHGNQREQVEAMGHDKFAALLQEHDVRLGMLTRYDLGPFRLGGELKVAAKFGADLVVCGSRGPRNLKGTDLKAAVRKFLAEMRPHVAAAEKHEVTIGIENHSGALIRSPDSIRWLCELSPSRRLGVALAPYHLPQDPELLARLIRDVGPGLVHFYAWQHGKGCHKKLPKAEELEQMPGRGKLDFVPIVAALAKARYAGRTEIFMHPVPRGIPILETTDKVTAEINRARRYMESCVKKAR